jgi:UDP-N-acetylglucosamine--N-acetylmuramyl-(pentapeptide) pyrophosphoryl-undecaprenol N-acetylglucosamine transferase
VRVVIAGGGTAGHVNPAIALGRALNDAEVTFVGTAGGAEANLVPTAKFPLEIIQVRGFDRSRPWTLLGVGATALRATRTAARLLSRLRPDVVVGMGGYVSLPVCVAARAKRIPVVLHEQNIVFGLANRVCKAWATRVAVSFEETLDQAGTKGVNTGNPVAPELAEMDAETERAKALQRFELDPERKTLLVFGGSQGAKTINEVVPGLVTKWRGMGDRQVLHISGRSHNSLLEEANSLATENLIYRGVEFVDRMPEVYAVADVALCRGGATTVAELGAVGLPAVIVPYPYHRDRQQERHGLALAQNGAAVVVPDNEVTPERIAGVVDRLFDDARSLDEMRAAARAFGRPDASMRLADVVREAAA